MKSSNLSNIKSNSIFKLTTLFFLPLHILHAATSICVRALSPWVVGPFFLRCKAISNRGDTNRRPKRTNGSSWIEVWIPPQKLLSSIASPYWVGAIASFSVGRWATVSPADLAPPATRCSVEATNRKKGTGQTRFVGPCPWVLTGRWPPAIVLKVA
jgi:hypothetical protein